nr:hypothetical protein CFP56_06217 [Quercus suber]
MLLGFVDRRRSLVFGSVLLGFWVAQINDGFGGDRRGSQRGHGEVVRGGDGGGFQWVLLWILMAIASSQSHPLPI